MRYLFLILLLFAAPARAEMNAELARDYVDISTGFNGETISLFGTTDEDNAEIIISIKGPESIVAVRRKGRVLGAWINKDTVEFRRVPSYYDIASTFTPDDEFAKEHEIGFGNLDFYAENESNPEKVHVFKEALIRKMQAKGFVPEEAKQVRRIDAHFFKTTFILPPDIPTGLYTVDTYIFRDNKLLGHESRKLQVGQVGFNANVYITAHEHSFFYGLFTVFVALISGWSAFTFLRRD